MSFNGSATCPRCSKTVYAAEQIMGPGRKFYHKPCLACMTCKKRLDSLTLLEHDQEPYCKSCHGKNFGTHNIGSRTPADAFRTPPRKRPTADTDVESPLATDSSPLDGPARAFDFLATDPTATPPADADSEQLTPSRALAPIAERYATAAAVQRRHMTGDGAASPTPLPRTLTGGGSPSPRRYGGDTPKCARCEKSVFFAEQVKAVGKLYHKGCLRCTAPSCGALLDSNRLRDHDGEPMCARCHTKMWGKGGLDKGPTLLFLGLRAVALEGLLPQVPRIIHREPLPVRAYDLRDAELSRTPPYLIARPSVKHMDLGPRAAGRPLLRRRRQPRARALGVPPSGADPLRVVATLLQDPDADSGWRRRWDTACRRAGPGTVP
ncbi:hypothetical protein DFH09DRAFT_1366051 [Mycena vulgaris]|nr:hypothetical protein DFH09DRAFT_1366051 [Mycena vulgaris]